tara:strand:- start:497 stop:859 length:363 start_codon:yes stop_codon:yes gene_type:complete
MRRFRRRPNGRNHMSRNSQPRMRTNQFVNGQTRNNFRTSMSVEKSFEKYSSLAKEAMSAGDKTLSENYLQHADHFMRMIEDKNRNRNLTKDNIADKSPEENKSFSESNNKNDKEEIKSKD